MKLEYEPIYRDQCLGCVAYKPKTKSNCIIYTQLILGKGDAHAETYLKRYMDLDKNVCTMYRSNSYVRA